MSLGNDVVDLGDPEARLDGLHPRFAERVFTPAEREALDASRERPVLHWALWAAKESAYKALARAWPGTVFAPRAFEVELPGPPRDGAPATGRVRHGGRSFAIEVSRQSDILHAVAWDPDGSGAAGIRAAVGPAGDDPGAAVRRLAARDIAAALGLGPDELSIAGRPPAATRAGRPLDLVLSLSHHGRFVAVACTGPRREPQARAGRPLRAGQHGQRRPQEPHDERKGEGEY